MPSHVTCFLFRRPRFHSVSQRENFLGEQALLNVWPLCPVGKRDVYTRSPQHGVSDTCLLQQSFTPFTLRKVKKGDIGFVGATFLL